MIGFHCECKERVFSLGLLESREKIGRQRLVGVKLKLQLLPTMAAKGDLQ